MNEHPGPTDREVEAVDRVLREWRMEDTGDLWCPPEEQSRLVDAVIQSVLAHPDGTVARLERHVNEVISDCDEYQRKNAALRDDVARLTRERRASDE